MMGRLLRACSLVVWLLVSGSSWGQEDANGDLSTALPKKESWWSSLFGSDEPEPPAATPEAAPPTPKKVEYEQAMNAFHRRMMVLDRLRDIAVQTQNDDLLKEVESLEERVFNVCQTRKSSRNLVTPPAPRPATSSDEDYQAEVERMLRGDR
jgi:hypothetical protein